MGKSKTTYETTLGGNYRTYSITGNNGGMSSWGIDTAVQGNLFLMFHF
jgi:hypothetical protein